MGDCLLEGRAAQSLVARLAPPFDRKIAETGLDEMMGDRFGLGVGVAQSVGLEDMRRGVELLRAVQKCAYLAGISGVGEKPSSAGARTAWASKAREVD